MCMFIQSNNKKDIEIEFLFKKRNLIAGVCACSHAVLTNNPLLACTLDHYFTLGVNLYNSTNRMGHSIQISIQFV